MHDLHVERDNTKWDIPNQMVSYQMGYSHALHKVELSLMKFQDLKYNGEYKLCIAILAY